MIYNYIVPIGNVFLHVCWKITRFLEKLWWIRQPVLHWSSKWTANHQTSTHNATALATLMKQATYSVAYLWQHSNCDEKKRTELPTTIPVISVASKDSMFAQIHCCTVAQLPPQLRLLCWGPSLSGCGGWSGTWHRGFWIWELKLTLQMLVKRCEPPCWAAKKCRYWSNVRCCEILLWKGRGIVCTNITSYETLVHHGKKNK